MGLPGVINHQGHLGEHKKAFINHWHGASDLQAFQVFS